MMMMMMMMIAIIMLINEGLFVAKLGMLTNRATQMQLFQTQMRMFCDAKV
jgi:hypothetical protein